MDSNAQQNVWTVEDQKHPDSRLKTTNAVEQGNQYTKKRKTWNISVTVSLTLSMIAMGMFLEIVGPTLTYLKTRLAVNYEEVSRALVARSVGYFIGSIAGGFLIDAFPQISYVNFSVCYLLAAIGTTIAPWCTSLGSLGLMFFLQGVAQGCGAGLNATVMRMWGDKSSPALVSQHLGFGIGALIAPQIANAFVWELPSSYTERNFTTTEIAVTTIQFITTPDSRPKVKENIEYAYLIIGLICVIFAIWFVVAFMIERCYKPIVLGSTQQVGKSFMDFVKLLSPGTCSGGDPLFGTFFFVFLALLYVHIVGGERAISKFIHSYAIESNHKFESNTASLLNSAFWFAFTSGRAVNTAAALLIKPDYLLGIIVVFNVLSALVLAIWAATNATVLWMFSCAYGFFMSMLFPTALVWANQYVEMTAIAVAVGYVGSAIGGMIYQWLTGYLFQYHGPDTLMYVLLGCTVNLALVHLVLQIMGCRHGNRFENANTESEKKSDICTHL